MEEKKDTPDRGNSAYKEEKYKSVWHDQWKVAFWLPGIHVERTQKSSLPSSQKGGGIRGEQEEAEEEEEQEEKKGEGNQ